MRRLSPHRRGHQVEARTVLITGAARGLGAATAHELAARGAQVVIADRDIRAARATAATLPRGRGRAVECDVTDAESVVAATAFARAEFGHIDVAIANAGILGSGATVRAHLPGQVEKVFAVNVLGVLNTVRATLEDVIAHRGHIVLVSSVFAYMNGAGAVPYAMSKAAVEQLGRGLGVELSAHGAAVTTAFFSLIETDMIREGVDADPHLNALLSASPKFMLKRIRPEVAASSLVESIESRRRSLTVPSRWGPVSKLRGVLAPILDTRYARDLAIQRALSEMEAHHLAEREGAL